MAELVEEGKVRHLGLSEAGRRDDPPCPRRPPDHRRPVGVLALDARRRGRGEADWSRSSASASSPTRRSAAASSPARSNRSTTSTRDDYRRNCPRFEGENLERNLELVGVVEEIAAERDATPAQLALAWVLGRGEHLVPIPGTKRIPYLEENLGALEVELSEDDAAPLDEALPDGGRRALRRDRDEDRQPLSCPAEPLA